MTQSRGELTERIKEKSRELLGYEIGVTELRLLPYVQYIMVNEQIIDIRKINQEEREILEKWRTKEFVEGGASGLAMTKDFWDAICEIVFLGYVDLS